MYYMKYIKIASIKRRAIVDDEEYESISKYSWSLDRWGYAKNTKVILKKTSETKRKAISLYMHRIIMGAEKGEIVDHLNGNTLDNRKSNLRFCTASQSQWNKGARRDNKSGYKGVYFNKRERVWNARIGYLGKGIDLGRFKLPEDAAKAYNEAAKKYHGEFAFLNKV